MRRKTVKNTIQYIQSVFEDVVNVENVTTHNLPMYLVDKFDFLYFRLFGRSYVLVKHKKKEELYIENIKKDIAQIMRFTNKYPVFVLPNLRLYQRKTLIKNKIAFVVPNTQIFIPNPPIYLTEKESREKTETIKFKKSTQVVFAYLFLNKVDIINAHRLAEQLGYTATTINRALNELVDKELLIQSSNGTRKKYGIPDKRKYWELGKEYLFNPVISAHLFLKDRVNMGDKRLFKSSDTALCEYSDDFDDNSNREAHYACFTNDFRELHNESYPKSIEFSFSNFVALEVLSYNPALLSKDDKVDAVTLYAQYMDNHDERVEMALDKIIEEIING